MKNDGGHLVSMCGKFSQLASGDGRVKENQIGAVFLFRLIHLTKRGDYRG
jgi:hypothetical protein